MDAVLNPYDPDTASEFFEALAEAMGMSEQELVAEYCRRWLTMFACHCGCIDIMKHDQVNECIGCGALYTISYEGAS